MTVSRRSKLWLTGLTILSVGVLVTWRTMFVTGTAPVPDTPEALFQDRADEAGMHFEMNFLPDEQGQTFKINLYDHGCGLAVGDYDGDGHDDVYLLNQLGPNALFRNRGDGTFEDVTAVMGVALDDRICVGATFADYDNDGDQDLYVTSTRGGNTLFQNEQNQQFVDVTERAGLTHVGHSQTAVFFDYDRDALLDLYLVQTAEWTTNQYDSQIQYYPGLGGEGGFEGVLKAPREFNVLYRNNGNGTFSDVTDQAKLRGRGWSGDVAVFDYDQDGWLDVLITSMFGRAQLYRNQQNGTFSDVTLDVLGRTPFGGIGAKVFDFNNDGLLDIYVVDMHSDMWMGLDFSQASLGTAEANENFKFDYFYGPKVDGSAEYQQLEAELEDILDFRHEDVVFGNALYKCLGSGRYAEVSGAANMETFWPWGIVTGDFDNNGFVDVFVASGMGYPFYYWRNYLMMNSGLEVFQDRSFALGIEPPREGQFLERTINSTQCARSSRCAVTADFDGDGRLEIVTNNFNHEPYYYRNQGSSGSYVAFQLQGTQSNRDAVGALIRVPLGDQTLVRQLHSAGGYLSQSSKTIHFGIPDDTPLKRVEVSWPSGQVQVLSNVEVNRLHRLVEPKDDAS